MAAITPPRSTTPTPPRTVVAPKPRHNLQISPNLEALLQHDELTRRNSSSPTNGYYPSSTSSGFPFSLPPPPPRVANSARKAGQEPLPTTRNKDGQRSRNAVVASDFWPDAGAASPSASGPPSRPVSPNPYLNPAPVLGPASTPDLDEAPTPKQTDRLLLDETKSDSSRVAPETRGRAGAPDPTHRPSNALHKVEKILWIGRDSLNLFSGSANGVKRDCSDRRNDQYEFSDTDAVPDRQMRQVPAATSLAVSRPPSAFGDSDTATVAPSSKSATSHLHSLQRGQHSGLSSDPLYLTDTESVPTSDPPLPPLPPALLLPRLPLPSISMSHTPLQQHKSVDSISSNEYLSFIDFRSPSMPDEPNLCNIQDKSQETRASRQQLQSISIPPSNLYSIPCRSLSTTSLTSLASMKFAPPSPTTIHQPSPTYPASGSSTSSTGLPSMIFALPSPSAERIPTRLQPLSDPPSPYSPLEFAPPPSPRGAINGPLSAAPELVTERGRKLRSKKRSKSSSPYHVHNSASPLPPTTNELDATERADRIRRNRKLARVFGRTPGIEELWESDDPRVPKKSNPPSLAALLHRHAASVSVSLKGSGVTTELSTPWLENLWGPDGRRHSTPLASDFTSYVDDQQDKIPAKNPFRSRKVTDFPEASSARSFIDLSDEEPHDDVSELSCFVPYQNRHRRLHHSNSTPSLSESLDSVALVEVERRRKREKLAKLHRFLGSRVPPEAVNECVFGPPLPPLAPAEEPTREHWRRWSKDTIQDDFDRGREELDEREKALNVRRAQKMEKVFGTPPPQALFHTRPNRPTAPLSQPVSPIETNPYILHLDIPSSRNPNQSAYVRKTLHQPGPSDSSRCLLSENTPESSPSSLAQLSTDSFGGSLSGYQQELAQSSVYLNYQHSLNSLTDIIDRDDRQSLIELHRFLHGCGGGGGADDSSSEDEVPVNHRRMSTTTSLRSERRHSLPSTASVTSLSSQFSVSSQVLQFRIRRRTAAKLTNFFGVDYRELIQDILESIEKGVEDERKQGTLQPQEVEVLMHRVRSLRKLKTPCPS